MDESERQELLEDVNRQSATVGRSIPDTLTVGDEELPLEEFLIETRKVDGIPDDLKPLVRDTQRKLSQERERLVERLESEPLEREAAEEIADTIVGIDRALNALRSLRRDGFAAETKSASLDDHKRWVEFMQSVRD
ncbi:hypothetical protein CHINAEXTREME_04700 [Halobiforma lacisalsi AJ5]|uniref:Uncharacterized protein n=1 Tax=Natronobacterium lacisalsi AJ5 TaxID=358396 RepID=M0LLQ3_NATLA|nr:DUF5788 family protein [Halobiforma lacisalsi]APW97109.1 hypothetical protein CHINAEXTREME_04700 [Halobiforma lacisalsi AJ5]EMA34446.1 hypothetical protein C445_07967 [Halobiforma lacisalsi AJ5]